MNKTKIEWADSTWNPVTGCLHGCKYCYARRIANRFGGDFSMAREGKLLTLYNKPDNPYPDKFSPTFHRYRLDEPAKKTKGQNIFVCSMADLFGEWVPDEWINQVISICIANQQHNYLFLTKNPERYTKYGVPAGFRNIWYGTSVTRESEMSRFNYLPAHCRTFVSMEPISEDLNPEHHNILFRQINWIIIGAETGNRKDKIIPQRQWIKRIVLMAYKESVPVFMKDSLIPIIGEENMLREFPEGLKK